MNNIFVHIDKLSDFKTAAGVAGCMKDYILKAKFDEYEHRYFKSTDRHSVGLSKSIDNSTCIYVGVFHEHFEQAEYGWLEFIQYLADKYNK